MARYVMTRGVLSAMLGFVLVGCKNLEHPAPALDTLVVTRELLQPVTGRHSAAAYGLNAAGVIVGKSWGEFSTYQRATRWAVGLGPAALWPGDPDAGPSTYATAITEAGDIAGYLSPFTDEYTALLWDAAGKVDTLGPGIAYALNNARQVVGCYITPGLRHWMAILWAADTSQDLGTLGGLHSCAYAINDSGWVAGSAWTPEGAEHAFLWKPGSGLIDLGSLYNISRAYGLNNRGEVVGVTGDDPERPFYWTAAEGMIELPLLGGTDGVSGSGIAYAINDAGDIVGYSTINTLPFPGFESATLWRSRTAPPLNLTDLAVPGSDVATFARAFAISRSGVIAGYDAADSPPLHPRGAVWRVSIQQ